MYTVATLDKSVHNVGAVGAAFHTVGGSAIDGVPDTYYNMLTP